MDILGNKKVDRGDHGYIDHIKKHNLMISSGLLISCIIVFIVGLTIDSGATIVLNLISVLLILPTAQFMARYFSVFRYKALTNEEFDALESISEDFLVLGELPIVRGKKGYYTFASVVTKVGIYVLIEPSKDVTASRKQKLDTKQALVSLVKPKGHQQEIHVYDDYEALFKTLKQEVKSKASAPDMKELGKIAAAFISKTI